MGQVTIQNRIPNRTIVEQRLLQVTSIVLGQRSSGQVIIESWRFGCYTLKQKSLHSN